MQVPSIAPEAAPQRSAWEVQRTVLFALLLRELKTRFGGRWLGFLWVLGEPLLHVLLMMFIFGYVRERVLPGVDYVVFLITGLMPFLMFKSLVLRLLDAVDANRGLLAYRQVRPIDTMLSRALLEIGLYSVVYLAVLAIFGWGGLDVLPRDPLELIGISAGLLCAGFGIGVSGAVLTDDFPRARSLFGLLFFPLYLVSGVIVPLHALPTEALRWLTWNPVLHAVELARSHFMPGYQALPQVSGAYVAGFGLVSMALGLSLYRVRRDRLLAS